MFKNLFKSITAGIFPVSLFHHAIIKYQVKKIDFYLKYFINEKNINQSDKHSMDGYTPLHYAALHLDLALAQKLLNAGANPDVLTHTGQTALLILLEMPQRTSSKHEANFFVLDDDNKVVNPKIKQIIELLMEHGTNLNIKNPLGDNALAVAIQKAHFDVIPQFLAQGCCPLAKNLRGTSAMYWAWSFLFRISKKQYRMVIENIFDSAKTVEDIDSMMDELFFSVEIINIHLQNVYHSKRLKLSLEESLDEHTTVKKVVKI